VSVGVRKGVPENAGGKLNYKVLEHLERGECVRERPAVVRDFSAIRSHQGA
jgi:hypothetical protein